MNLFQPVQHKPYLYFFDFQKKWQFLNYIYDYIAKNRYKWYGKKETCLIPTEEQKTKFLE